MALQRDKHNNAEPPSWDELMARIEAFEPPRYTMDRVRARRQRERIVRFNRMVDEFEARPRRRGILARLFG